MAQRYFVTGTDTDVGKSVACAWLMLQLDGCYWKPVQAGTEGGTDADFVAAATGLPATRFFPSTYTLTQPLSPHEAARRDGVAIELSRFQLPACQRPLVVEGAGGLLVPLNRGAFVIDLIARIAAPVVLVCRSGLGTINHTLLSLEALARRGLPVAGLVVNGPKMPHNREALAAFGGVPVIAEIPHLSPLTREALLGIRPQIDLAAGE